MHTPAPAALTEHGTSRAARPSIELACPDDDAGIRALLRRSPMGRAIRLTLEREPDFAASAVIDGPRGATAVVRARDTGEVLALGHRAVRRRYWNGRPAWLGYLGSLRRDERLRGQARLLRDGFRAVAATRAADELPFDLTAIVSDNSAARRLLERGLPGFPRYVPLASLVTVAIARERGRLPAEVRPASLPDLPEVAASLARWGAGHDGAAEWTAEELLARSSDPAPLGPILLLEERGRMAGCCAIWDLRPFRQARIHRYGGLLRWLLPFDRAVSPLLGRPPLPRPGESLGIVACSHLSCLGADETGADQGTLLRRFNCLLCAARRSMPATARWITITLPRSSPLLTVALAVRSAPPIESELYAVGAQEAVEAACASRDGRAVHVEGALL